MRTTTDYSGNLWREKPTGLLLVMLWHYTIRNLDDTVEFKLNWGWWYLYCHLLRHTNKCTVFILGVGVSSQVCISQDLQFTKIRKKICLNNLIHSRVLECARRFSKTRYPPMNASGQSANWEHGSNATDLLCFSQYVKSRYHQMKHLE